LTKTPDELREEIIDLGPWHLNVEVTPEVSTSVSRDAAAPTGYAKRISFHDHRPTWTELITSVYPNGLEGRSVLDCACNCGGYLFWMKEMGAGDCLGFDVREHWIDQARFLKRWRTEPSDGMSFEVCDLYDLPSRDPGEFDVSIFKGLFYHLPDPISGLKLVADRTRELLILNTSTSSGFPDGLLEVKQESAKVEHVMSGVHGLSWRPTGPEVLASILGWMGFSATRCTFWVKETARNPAIGRIQILAARDESTFESYDARSGAGSSALAPSGRPSRRRRSVREARPKER
jgi:2-polyprenyl-3-methyl-5-hydroxy-6-metoxy-1,4-benzoquinol methylase